jgi:O-antigen/teichoic acid export membrane protein
MSLEPLDIKFAQRLPANLISNLLFFILSIIVGLFLVPFFLDTLGTVAYGLIPLATSITGYVTLVIDSLNTSISRFLTIDLQRADVNRANETFNTALFGTLAIIIILIPFALLGAWYAPSFFNIGDQSSMSVTLLFAFIFGSVFIRTWGSNFMVVLFAYNRLEQRNYVNIVNLFTQLVCVIGLFLIFGPSLPLVGLSYMGAAAVSFVLAYILSRRTCSYLTISPGLFKRSRLKEMGGMSIWVLINSVGLLLNTQVALFIVNLLFGAVSGAQYSLAALWGSLLMGLAGPITSLFSPMIYSYYSRHDRRGMIHFSSTATKIVGLIMALPTALVCIFSPQLLTLWVGSEFAHLAPLIWICVAPIIIQIMASCTSPIIVAYNRVRTLALLTLSIGALNVILAISLPTIVDIGMYGVALAGLITLAIKYGFINPLFVAQITQVSKYFYLKYMAHGIGGLSVLLIFGTIFNLFFDIVSLPSLIISILGISIIYLLLVLRCALTTEERVMLHSCIPRTFQKWIPTWLQ